MDTPQVSTNDSYHSIMRKPYVYKICRSKSPSSGIRLRQLFFKSTGFDVKLLVLFEPFLFFYESYDNNGGHFRNERSIVVSNLLESNTAPMKVGRGSSMQFCNFCDKKIAGVSRFESDMRINGKLPESVLFLVVYKPTPTSLCFECLEIKTSAISTLWSRIVDVEFDEFDYNCKYLFSRSTEITMS